MQSARKHVARLKLRHLSVICAVGRTGSLQKASDQLMLTQSAISKTLSEAEEIMAAQLFERTPFGSRATLLGEVLARYGAKVLADLERAGDEIDILAQGESGTLTVGIFTPMGWWGALSRCVADFQKIAPQVRLTLRQGSMSELMSALERDEIDVVIGRAVESTQPGARRIVRLCDDGGPKFVARITHPLTESEMPLTLEQIVAYPWFLPEEPNTMVGALRTEVRDLGLTWPHRIIYSHVYTVNLAICAKSDMIALLPDFVVPEVGAAYHLRKLAYNPPFSLLPLSAVWREDCQAGIVVQKFVDRLKAICTET